jgi:hypothetical protein
VSARQVDLETCSVRSALVPAPLERRTFLGLLAAAATSGFVPSLVVERLAHASRASARPDGVVQLGRAYLLDHPEDASVERLSSLLTGLDTTKPVRDQLPAIAEASTAEFAAGTAVVVQGWLLAHSEARAAAAIALGA